VVDLAEAHVAAIKRLLQIDNEKPFEVFNLGTGKGVSVLEIIKSFEQSTGQKVNYVVADRRQGDVEQIFGSPALANQKLNWKAQKNLDETLASAWQWEMNLRKTAV